ncbi:DUF6036 family nucleotidyltransferase [Endothiovibrio diazotrophicus]
MKRHELEHLIRAAGAVADELEVIVVGSQAILGQFPNAPADALLSMEADLIPVLHPERWNLIDGVLGEGSPFHEEYGYYADGVETTTAVLPRGWKKRLIPIRNENTRGVTGLCLEVHDLLVSKYVAGREKDLEFCSLVVRSGMADVQTLLARVEATELDRERLEVVKGRVRRDGG